MLRDASIFIVITTLAAASCGREPAPVVTPGAVDVLSYAPILPDARLVIALERRVDGELVRRSRWRGGCVDREPDGALYHCHYDLAVYRDGRIREGRLVFDQYISADETYTYSFERSDGTMEVEPNRFVDLRAPVQVGATWDFSVKMPLKLPFGAPRREETMAFHSRVVAAGERYEADGLRFDGCVRVRQETAVPVASVTCRGTAHPSLVYHYEMERIWCPLHGDVHTESDHFMTDADGAVVKGCGVMTATSRLVAVEET